MKQILKISFVLLFVFTLLINLPSPALATSDIPKGATWLGHQKWKLPDGTYNWAGIESDFADFQRADISWIRLRLLDDDENFNDQVIALLNQYNLKPVAIVWGTPNKSLGTDTDRQATKDRMTNWVNKYKDTIHVWEAQNEPNDPGFWTIDTKVDSNQTQYAIDLGNYILRLKDIYESIKAVDPDAQIMLGGLSEYRVERWMDEFTSQQGYLYTDLIGYHPYNKSPDNVIRRVESLKSKMSVNPILNSKPIWITEFGFHKNTTQNSLMNVGTNEKKADYLQQTMQKLHNFPGVADPIFWYTFVEPQSTFDGYGLIVKDNTTLATTYLPAFNAMRDLWNPTFITFIPTLGDTYVTQNSANSNFGSASELKVRGGNNPIQASYFQFNMAVPELIGSTITGAKFKVATNASGSAGTQNLVEVKNAWLENTLTYNNKPQSGPTQLGSLSNAATYLHYDIPLNLDYIKSKQGNSFSFVINSPSTDDVTFQSRETANKPQLVIYYTPPIN